MTVREVVLDRDIRAPIELSSSTVLNRFYLRRSASVVVLLLLDLISVLAAVALAPRILGWFGLEVSTPSIVELAVAMALVVTVFAVGRLYGLREQRHSLWHIVRAGFAALVAVIVAHLIAGSDLDRLSLMMIWVFALLFILLGRTVYDLILRYVFGPEIDHPPVLLIGRPDLCGAVLEAMKGVDGNGYRALGLVTEEPVAREWQDDTGVQWLGGLDNLERVVYEEGPAQLVISDPEVARRRMPEIVELCRKRHIALKLASLDGGFGPAPVTYVPGFGLPLFVVKSPAPLGWAYVAKRCLDVVISALSLVLLSPLIAAFAVAIKLDSRGPVFFVDERIGLGQKTFRCYKFRTMCADAACQQPGLERLNEAGGAMFKIRDDPRVTRVGRFLRRTSLDELPQLFNVIKGDMSLVGPRPLPVRDFKLMDDWDKRRHVVLPGLTGLWQISGRSDLDFDDMIKLDFKYIETWSVASDLGILAKTFKTVVSSRGAY